MLRDYQQQELIKIIEEEYGIRVTIKLIYGFYDRNYYVKEIDNPQSKYILKISRHEEKEDVLKLQCHTLISLKQLKVEPCHFPELILTTKGQQMVKLKVEDKVNLVRLLKFVEGNELVEFKELPDSIFFESGVLAAKLTTFLEGVTKQQKSKELINNLKKEDFIQDICVFPDVYKNDRKYLDEEIVGLVDKTMEEYLEVAPLLKDMPKQLIHNDLCLTNLLAKKQEEGGKIYLSGAIDWNSLTYCEPILELVVLAARINMDDSDPLKNMMLTIKGFSSIKKISEQEKKVIFPLIKARLGFIILLTWREFVLNNQEQYMVEQKVSMKHYIEVLSKEGIKEQFEKELQKATQ